MPRGVVLDRLINIFTKRKLNVKMATNGFEPSNFESTKARMPLCDALTDSATTARFGIKMLVFVKN